MKNLTQDQKDLLIGTLLGDGNLSTSTKSREAWGYNVQQQAAHWEYVLHKYNIMEPFCTTGPKFITRNFLNRKTTYCCYFSTLRTFKFKFYGRMFYKKDESGFYKKCVPKNIHRFLTSQALAFWYMDDGYLTKHAGCLFSVHCFSLTEVQYLQNALEKNFKIKTTLHKQRGLYCIYIKKCFVELFMSIISKYVVPVMSYKLKVAV